MEPFLGDLAGHLILTVEREQHFVDALHQVHVLLLRDLVAGPVLLRLGPQQLPVFAADSLEVSMHEDAALISLGHNRVDHESYR